jgi:ligand-binding SRPBCC domain-containing protein
MRNHFQTEQWLPYAPELVFAFFANPENLPRLMPRWQSARIEEATFAPTPARPAGAPRYPGIAAGDGTCITLSIRPFPLSPIRLPWKALIEDFHWNQGFCDVQVDGPFQYWRHCHTVEAAISPDTGAAGSIVRDQVNYEVPFGFFGRLLHRILIRGRIAAIFRYRQKRTSQLLALMTGA